MDISGQVKRVQDNIAAACARAHRREADVTLVAVTKFVPVERIRPAILAGIAHVGENRVQELVEKLPFFNEMECTAHFIGQLQTNKVKYITGQVQSIQSVDRAALADEIQKQAQKREVVQDIFIEVNIGGEAQKGGIDANDLLPFLAQLQENANLCVKGLMCVPPAVGQEEARPYFAKMKALFDTCCALPNSKLQHLSMGMSGDYAAAIEEGATMVRVGSAIFGKRM
ncbi:YggS family pyridoxal phosphate-dependent enzyme [Christensenellaceae bacterium OttesenSCG-928-L17]|nr:YggS family pyridoxal phosphate-dependent enzyme [Christensenellaceae bacterium OttesenSCG-928-L17]